MTASAAYSSWIRRDYASKSQQVVLAAAVFDSKGRIMVNQEGFLPTEVVTDTLVPKVGVPHPQLRAYMKGYLCLGPAC